MDEPQVGPGDIKRLLRRFIQSVIDDKLSFWVRTGDEARERTLVAFDEKKPFPEIMAPLNESISLMNEGMGSMITLLDMARFFHIEEEMEELPGGQAIIMNGLDQLKAVQRRLIDGVEERFHTMLKEIVRLEKEVERLGGS